MSLVDPCRPSTARYSTTCTSGRSLVARHDHDAAANRGDRHRRAAGTGRSPGPARSRRRRSPGSTSVATVAFLWFVAVIRRRIGTREDQFFSTVFVGSGIVLIVSRLLASAAAVSPAIGARLLGAGDLESTEIAIAEGLGGAVALVVAPRMQAVFVIATSTVVLRSRALPLWLAYLGYALGLTLFVVPFLIEPMGFLFPAWVLLVSVVVLVTRTHDLDDDVRPVDAPV